MRSTSPSVAAVFATSVLRRNIPPESRCSRNSSASLASPATAVAPPVRFRPLSPTGLALFHFGRRDGCAAVASPVAVIFSSLVCRMVAPLPLYRLGGAREGDPALGASIALTVHEAERAVWIAAPSLRLFRLPWRRWAAVRHHGTRKLRQRTQSLQCRLPCWGCRAAMGAVRAALALRLARRQAAAFPNAAVATIPFSVGRRRLSWRGGG